MILLGKMVQRQRRNKAQSEAQHGADAQTRYINREECGQGGRISLQSRYGK